MLETVDLKAKLSKAEYKSTFDKLDLRLGELQRGLRVAGVPVVVVLEGWDAAGKGTVLSRLLQPLDPRGYQVHNTTPPTEHEQMFPPFRRFWLSLPNDGTIAIYNQSWYRKLLESAIEGGLKQSEKLEAYENCRVFERQLSDDGAVIVKFFLHISKKEQAKRFKKLKEDPAFAWKVSKTSLKQHKKYEEYAASFEDVVRETSTAWTPWHVVPATDDRFACVTVAETLVAAFEKVLAKPQPQQDESPGLPERRTSPLDRVDTALTTSPKTYDKKLPALQKELCRLQHLCYVQRRPVAIVYQGWDAAGKGGNIRRLIRELDPRGYEVVPIAAPQGEEKTHHYLWRFWKALPKAGHFAIYDRSWYGRVLVERVEGFAPVEAWERAYREINEFESQLVEFGMVLIKFWIHISKEEQLRRFKAREETPHKQWKITEEDWRNREKWDTYWDAVSDMIERTSTAHAPWVIVEGDDKRHARIKTLETVVKRLRSTLKVK